MRIIKSIISFLVVLLCAHKSFAGLYTANNLSELQASLISSLKTKNPSRTLVILPLEDFFFIPQSPELLPQEGEYRLIVKQNIDQIKYSRRPYLDELIMVKYAHGLSDSAVIGFVQEVQKLNVPLIVVTRNVSGSLDDIKYLEVWTWMQLYEHGINLALSPVGEKQYRFVEGRKAMRGTYPTFFRGLLSCNSYERQNSPQNVIASLLVNKLNWLPDTVYVVDKDEGYIKSLIEQFKNLKQEMLVEGFVYKPKIYAKPYKKVNKEKFKNFWEQLVASLNQVKRIELESEIEDPYEQ